MRRPGYAGTMTGRPPSSAGTPRHRGIRIAVLRTCAALAVAAAALSGCSSDGKGTPAWTAGSSPAEQCGRLRGADAGARRRRHHWCRRRGPPRPAGGAGLDGVGLEGFHRSGEERQFRAAAGLDCPVGGPGGGNHARRAEDRGQGRQGRLPRHPADRTPAAARRGLRRTTPPAPTSWSAASRWTCRTAAARGPSIPHVVFRVIQGYKYFGSYGITNVVGGAGGKACALQNLVRGPEGKGDYSFGDLAVLKAFAPGPEGCPRQGLRHPRPGGQIRQRGLRIRQRPADANVSEDQKLVPPARAHPRAGDGGRSPAATSHPGDTWNAL